MKAVGVDRQAADRVLDAAHLAVCEWRSPRVWWEEVRVPGGAIGMGWGAWCHGRTGGLPGGGGH